MSTHAEGTRQPTFGSCLLSFAIAGLLLINPANATRADDAQSSLTSALSNAAIDPDTRAALVSSTHDLEWSREELSLESGESIDLHLGLTSESARLRQRVLDAVSLSLRVFSTWYGDVPAASLVIVDVPWRSRLAGASYPGVIAMATRWIAPVRDMTLERSLIGAIARQYLFHADIRSREPWFDEALVLYTATRAVHEALENRDTATVRYLGGFVPVVIRPVQWSPNRADPRPRVRHFPEIELPTQASWRASTVEAGSAAQRAALALHSLERYIGWPAMQQALSTYRSRASIEGGSPALLSQVVSEQRGRDLSWFFTEAFRPDVRFDYAIESLTCVPMAADSNQYETTVGLRRVGDATFTGTNESPAGAFESGRAMTLAVTFEDGSVIEESWDGRDAERRVEYVSRSPAVSASLDPRAVLLLDEDRTNNTRSLRRPFQSIGARLAVHWMVWLQDLMLSYASLV